MATSTSTSHSTTSRVYIQVIEDVMNKVGDEFALNSNMYNNGGPGEEVLKELQATWETKLMQALTMTQDYLFFTSSSGKRKRDDGDDFPSGGVFQIDEAKEENQVGLFLNLMDQFHYLTMMMCFLPQIYTILGEWCSVKTTTTI